MYLTVAVEDCKNAQVKIESDKVIFKGTGGDKHTYECTLTLYGKLKVDESKFVTRDRATEMLLVKESKGEYWPRLLKDTTKMHWLKVDFNKWKDEDDSDAEDMSGGNFEEMMRQIGGFGGPDAAGGKVSILQISKESRLGCVVCVYTGVYTRFSHSLGERAGLFVKRQISETVL